MEKLRSFPALTEVRLSSIRFMEVRLRVFSSLKKHALEQSLGELAVKKLAIFNTVDPLGS